MEIKTVKVTEFGKRHFEPKFGGTKIIDRTPEEFADWANSQLYAYYKLRKGTNFIKELTTNVVEIFDGYADFCKLVCLKNVTSAKTGSLPITLENYQYLRTGYSSRTPNELPVMERWFDLPLPAPKAEYLMVVLYSKEQIIKEHSASEYKDEPLYFDADYGIVAILGQMSPEEEPIKPITMMRNSLGINEGGSGVPIDRDKYKKSVDFWSKFATVK